MPCPKRTQMLHSKKRTKAAQPDGLRLVKRVGAPYLTKMFVKNRSVGRLIPARVHP
jgi:hypothetical protein